MEKGVESQILESLKRLEVGQAKQAEINTRILEQISGLKSDFSEHKGDDRNNFQAVASRFSAVYKKLEDQDVTRLGSFDSLEKKLSIINGYVNNIKGAWWLVTVTATIVSALAGLAYALYRIFGPKS